MATKWYQGEIVGLNQLNSNTNQYLLAVEELNSFDFIPGQFITLDLPVSEKRLQRWRSYSIASHPDDTNIIELCISKSKDGVGTKYLFEDVTLGTKLNFKGPDGGFTTPRDLNNEITMICTGTGIAPFRSMIRHIIHRKIEFHKIHLIFGSRSFEDILYREELEQYAQDVPQFSYDVALSREQKAGYHHGYLHDLYMNEYHHVQENRHFYICGWTKMIDETVTNLIKMGYDKSQIHYELYG